MKRKNFGVVQLPLLIGLIIVAAALPIVSKLTKESQDTRNRAAEECDPTACSQFFGCSFNNCGGSGMGQFTCNCSPIPTDSPNWTANANVNCGNCNQPTNPPPTNTPTPIVFNCTPSDSNISLKAFKADGTTEVNFGVSDGQLVIDERFGSENKVVFEVTISNKSGIKNVGLQFGDVGKAFAKFDGTKWNGTVEGSGLGFFAQPDGTGNLTVKFPLQVNFAKDTDMKVTVQYY